LQPLDVAEVKELVAKDDKGKKSKALWEAHVVAAEQHDLKYFKEVLQQHEQNILDEQEALRQAEAEKEQAKAEAEAKKAEAKAKKEKRKSEVKVKKSTEDEGTVDVDGDASAKKKGTKRKKPEGGDGDAKVCLTVAEVVFYANRMHAAGQDPQSSQSQRS
jgi:hypothetical protein